jgi:transcriptional regulator with XRE-family HTH domain
MLQAMTIEQKIRSILKAGGWKQQKLAEELGVSQATVSRWLSGSEPEGHRRDAINDLYAEIVERQRSQVNLSLPERLKQKMADLDLDDIEEAFDNLEALVDKKLEKLANK